MRRGANSTRTDTSAQGSAPSPAGTGIGGGTEHLGEGSVDVARCAKPGVAERNARFCPAGPLRRGGELQMIPVFSVDGEALSADLLELLASRVQAPD